MARARCDSGKKRGKEKREGSTRRIRREEERVGFNGEGREERNADGGGKLEDKEERGENQSTEKESKQVRKRKSRRNKRREKERNKRERERERRAIVLSKRIAGEGASISRASLASASR